jgi:AraC-like DNA-binding protein
MRILLALSLASYGAVLIVADVMWPGSSVSAPFSIVNAAGVATKTFVIALLWLGIAHEASAVSPAASDQRSLPRPEAPAADALDRQEAALLEALRELMEEQKLHRHDGLTIAVLAARLAIPEYRLRRLINRRLGHRNFSSFVNGYRLAEARAALADPVQENVPILTIALDTGFQSLAPFNRAFKMTAGMTPREYRRQHLTRPESGFAT